MFSQDLPRIPVGAGLVDTIIPVIRDARAHLSQVTFLPSKTARKIKVQNVRVSWFIKTQGKNSYCRCYIRNHLLLFILQYPHREVSNVVMAQVSSIFLFLAQFRSLSLRLGWGYHRTMIPTSA